MSCSRARACSSATPRQSGTACGEQNGAIQTPSLQRLPSAPAANLSRLTPRQSASSHNLYAPNAIINAALTPSPEHRSRGSGLPRRRSNLASGRRAIRFGEADRIRRDRRKRPNEGGGGGRERDNEPPRKTAPPASIACRVSLADLRRVRCWAGARRPGLSQEAEADASVGPS